MSGQRPTYRVCVLHKESGAKGTIGAAWQKDDGSISVRLEAGVTISWRDGFVISLFPIAPRPSAASEESDEPPPF
jgi:hypothetical protein